jgi:hypothetical protein
MSIRGEHEGQHGQWFGKTLLFQEDTSYKTFFLISSQVLWKR